MRQAAHIGARGTARAVYAVDTVIGPAHFGRVDGELRGGGIDPHSSDGTGDGPADAAIGTKGRLVLAGRTQMAAQRRRALGRRDTGNSFSGW